MTFDDAALPVGQLTPLQQLHLFDFKRPYIVIYKGFIRNFSSQQEAKSFSVNQAAAHGGEFIPVLELVGLSTAVQDKTGMENP